MDIIIVNLYLLLGTVQDIQKRKISNCYLWIGGIIGFVFRIINLKEESYSFSEWLLALIPGVILLLLAKVTGEKIGFGDGWVVIILGNFMTILEISMLLQSAVILVAIFALIFLLGRKISKEYSIPFLPFLWSAHFLLWRFGYV